MLIQLSRHLDGNKVSISSSVHVIVHFIPELAGSLLFMLNVGSHTISEGSLMVIINERSICAPSRRLFVHVACVVVRDWTARNPQVICVGELSQAGRINK
jgi:hypothetical protein